MRRNIAHQAARLMAEDGISDFGHAKRKAAKQLGAADTEALPNNAEVEEALRAYQALYQEEELRERLTTLRTLALEVMDFLGEFRPYLTGPVLKGTAGRFPQIDLEIFTDDSKAVEIFLLNQGVDYHHDTAREMTNQGAPESLLRFVWQEVPVSVAVFDPLAERNRRRNHAGQVAERARRDAVLALLRGEA